MINKVTLTNFKCFANKTSVPMSKFTVLYGKNGRGKSSIIQSILLLSQSLRANGGKLDSLIVGGDMVSLGTFKDICNYYSGVPSFKVEIETDFEDPLALSFKEDESRPTVGTLAELYVGEVSYIRGAKADSSQESSKDNNEGIKDMRSILPQSDIKTYDSLKTMGYVSADRRGPVNFEERRDFLPEIDVDPRGERLINHLSKKPDEFISRFEQELSLILSGASIRVKANVNTPDRIDLFLDSSVDNSGGFKPTNVGFGYSYVLPIVFKTLDAPDKGLIIIENPEAHLYPGAQSRLVDFLVKYANKKNLQVVLETHSDHIINGLRLAIKNKELSPSDTTVLFFDRDEDKSDTPKIVSIHVDKNGNMDNQPRDFMDEWTRQMLALL